jgi:hypothetical protein
MSITVKNLAAPKAGADHELSFNKLASEAGLLNKKLNLTGALGVTRFLVIFVKIW